MPVVEAMHDLQLLLKYLEIFSEILVMPAKLQFAVSRASLSSQKRFSDAVRS